MSRRSAALVFGPRLMRVRAATPPGWRCSRPSIAFMAALLASPRFAVAAGVVAAVLTLLASTSPVPAAAAPRDGVIAYEGRASANGYLYLRRADGSRPLRIRATGRPRAPSVSPLGRRIAFSSAGQIWVVYIDGTALRQVTSGPLAARAPSWSPAADALAFAGGPREAQDIYRIGADGSDLCRLTFGSGDEAPDWSSRDRVAFVRRSPRGDGDIFSVSGRGGRPRRLTRGKADDGEPAWSPDGRFIAFTRGGRDVHDVFVMRADGRDLRRLTRLDHSAVSPAWSPTGRSVAFALRGSRGRRWLRHAPRRTPAPAGRIEHVEPSLARLAAHGS
jgi:Tol biopolymer transport system component